MRFPILLALLLGAVLHGPPARAQPAEAPPFIELDRQVNHPNGTTLVVSGISPRRTTIVVRVLVTTGPESSRLADNGMVLVDDGGTRYPLVPPPDNRLVTVPVNSALEGELVFSGRLNPAATRVTLLTNERGGSPDNRGSNIPQMRVEIPLPQRTGWVEPEDGPEASRVAGAPLPGSERPVTVAALETSALRAAAQEAGGGAASRLGAGTGGAGGIAPGGLSLQQLRADLRVQSTPRGDLVSLPGDVLFDFDRWNIRPDAEATLRKLAELVLRTTPRRVLIEGHTDSRGGDAYNQGLSERRAASVAAWLATAGVERGIMQTRGYGRTRPVAPNARPNGADDPEGRQRNRRVEVVLQRA